MHNLCPEAVHPRGLAEGAQNSYYYYLSVLLLLLLVLLARYVEKVVRRTATFSSAPASPPSGLPHERR